MVYSRCLVVQTRNYNVEFQMSYVFGFPLPNKLLFWIPTTNLITWFLRYHVDILYRYRVVVKCTTESPRTSHFVRQLLLVFGPVAEL